MNVIESERGNDLADENACFTKIMNYTFDVKVVSALIQQKNSLCNVITFSPQRMIQYQHLI